MGCAVQKPKLDYGMTIHQHRKIVTGKCANCGAPFRGLKTRKTCSNKCRQALHKRAAKRKR